MTSNSRTPARTRLSASRCTSPVDRLASLPRRTGMMQ